MKLLEVVPSHLHCGRVKPLKRNFELLKLKSSALYDERDAIKEEMLKEVKQGKKPPRKCRNWLQKVIEFEHQVNDLLEYEHKSSNLDISKHMEIRDRLVDMINEIAELLDKSPFKHGTILRAQHGIRKRVTGLMTEAQACQRMTAASMGELQRQDQSKSKKNVDAVKLAALEAWVENVQQIMDAESSIAQLGTSVQEPEDRKQHGYVTTEETVFVKEVDTVSVVPSKDENAPALTSEIEELSDGKEADTVSVGPSKDENAPTLTSEIEELTDIPSTPAKDENAPALASEIEELSDGKEADTVSVGPPKDENAPTLTSEIEELTDIPSTPAMKLTLTTDSANSSGNKAKAIELQLPTAQISNPCRSEIELVPAQKEEALSKKETENVETISKKNDKNLSILRKKGAIREAETISKPSGIKDQELMKHKKKNKFKRLIELIKPVAVSGSGPSSETMMEPHMISHPEKKDEPSSINDVELTLPPGSELEIEGGQICVASGSFSRIFEAREWTRLSSIDQVLGPRVGAGLTELPPEKKWEKAEMMFLMDGEFSRLPEKPSCPKLLAFFLQRNSRLRTIPASFFDCMPSLIVLNLSKTKIRSLPPSLFKLTRLQVLILCHCEGLSELPPEVGNLECLEVLDLWGTEIYKLPDEIGNLSSLKHLRVSFYGSIDQTEYSWLPKNLITSGVISRLLALKELSIVVHPGDPRWDMNAEFVAQELGRLNELINLHFYFPEVKFLEFFLQISLPWISGKLSKFKFVVGQNVKRIASRIPKEVESQYDQEDRCLRYVNVDTVHDEVKKVLARATAFYLDHHCAISSLTEFGITNIEQLKFCMVRECPKMMSIVESCGANESALPNLKHLSIHYLWNLTHIWKGPMPDGSFNVLKTLSVHTCPNLIFVLAQPMLQYVSNLEELVVEDCASIKEIVKMEDVDNIAMELPFPKLKRLALHYLPQLVSIWNGSCLKIAQIIEISSCPKLDNSLKPDVEESANRG